MDFAFTSKDNPEPTRSIYDSAPINLFDYDDIEDKKDSDLFDELIGDDN